MLSSSAGADAPGNGPSPVWRSRVSSCARQRVTDWRTMPRCTDGTTAHFIDASTGSGRQWSWRDRQEVLSSAATIPEASDRGTRGRVRRECDRVDWPGRESRFQRRVSVHVGGRRHVQTCRQTSESVRFGIPAERKCDARGGRTGTGSDRQGGVRNSVRRRGPHDRTRPAGRSAEVQVAIRCGRRGGRRRSSECLKGRTTSACLTAAGRSSPRRRPRRNR